VKIEEKRFFFLYDDAFITGFNLKELGLIFRIAVENNLGSVALRKRVFDRGKKYNKKMYRINPTAKYRTSLFLNLIKKDLILSLLKSGETTWEFEKNGSKRSKNFDFYSFYKTKLVTYQHGIIKGKWIPKVYDDLKNKGYSLNENTFNKHSKVELLCMNIYTALFYTVHWFLHLFK
jgi:hypothetical protein